MDPQVEGEVSIEEEGNKILKLRNFILPYKIVNLVFTARYDQYIDLEMIQRNVQINKYDPNRFPGLSIKVPEKKVTFTFFKSGAVNGAGAKSRRKLLEAVEILKAKLEEGGISLPILDQEFEPQNLVMVGKLPFEVEIEKFYFRSEGYVEYEQERFPGLIFTRYRKLEPAEGEEVQFYLEEDIAQEKKGKFKKSTCLIFLSGRVVLTGFKNEEGIVPFLNHLYDKLESTGSLISN